MEAMRPFGDHPSETTLRAFTRLHPAGFWWWVRWGLGCEQCLPCITVHLGTSEQGRGGFRTPTVLCRAVRLSPIFVPPLDRRGMPTHLVGHARHEPQDLAWNDPANDVPVPCIGVSIGIADAMPLCKLPTHLMICGLRYLGIRCSLVRPQHGNGGACSVGPGGRPRLHRQLQA